MNYRKVERDAFKVFGKSTVIDMNDNKIPEFWTKSMQDGTMLKLMEIGKGSPVFGVCYGPMDAGTSFSYMIGVEALESSYPELEFITLPKSTYLVFESIGALPNSLQDLWKRIYSEFLPQNKTYKHAETPDFELYFEDDSSRDDYKCEVWIPVVLK